VVEASSPHAARRLRPPPRGDCTSLQHRHFVPTRRCVHATVMRHVDAVRRSCDETEVFPRDIYVAGVSARDGASVRPYVCVYVGHDIARRRIQGIIGTMIGTQPSDGAAHRRQREGVVQRWSHKGNEEITGEKSWELRASFSLARSSLEFSTGTGSLDRDAVEERLRKTPGFEARHARGRA